jgi:autoinducer 2-degrading protein
MYVVIVFLEARREHVAALRHALLSEARNSLEKEAACRQFDVSEDPLEPSSFLIYEVYDSETAFKAHLETEHFGAFSSMTAPWVASKRVLTYDLISDAGQA